MGKLTIAAWDDKDLLDAVLLARKEGRSITIAPPEYANLPRPSFVQNAEGLFNYRGHGAGWNEVERVIGVMKDAIGENVGPVACCYGIWHLYAIIACIASFELGNPWIDVGRSFERGELPQDFCAENKVGCLLTTAPMIVAALNDGADVSNLKTVIVLGSASDALKNALDGISLISIDNFCAAWQAGADKIA